MTDKKHIKTAAIICIILTLPLYIQSAADTSIDLSVKLHTAVLADASEEITKLIQLGADPHGRIARRPSPLETACIHGKISALETLLTYYDKSKQSDPQGYTLLHFAALSGKHEAIKLLCSKKEIHIEEQLPSGHTALHMATNASHEESVETLLEHKANPNAKCRDKNTPLHYACHNGDLAIIRLLVEAGADTNAPNAEGITPKEIAIELSSLPIQYYFNSLNR